MTPDTVKHAQTPDAPRGIITEKRGSYAALFTRIEKRTQPFFFSKSFMKETSASTPSIGNAL